MSAAMTRNTITSEGPVPHLLVKHADLRILAPVKLDFSKPGTWIVKQQGTFHPPLRRDGRLAFALPGGGEVLA